MTTTTNPAQDRACTGCGTCPACQAAAAELAAARDANNRILAQLVVGQQLLGRFSC